MSNHRHSSARPDRRARFTGDPPPRARRAPTAVMLGAGFLFLGSLVLVLGRGPTGGGLTSIAVTDAGPSGAAVTLPVSTFEDGQARFYRYTTAAGRELRFFVMKSSDGVIRAAFDSCDVCYRERRGYRQEGDVMVCNNCGRTFPSTQINVLQGGCNPAPIERTVSDGQVVLSAAALSKGVAYF